MKIYIQTIPIKRAENAVNKGFLPIFRYLLTYVRLIWRTFGL